VIYGLYQSAQGAQAQMQRIDVIANNLANASTTGFKRDLIAFQAHRSRDAEHPPANMPPHNLHSSSGGLSVAEVRTDHTNAPLTETGNTWDLAVHGPGFFSVAGSEGPLLTRNGSFSVDGRGELVTRDSGAAVLGESGNPVRIPPEARRIEISSDGTILQVDAVGTRSAIDRLAIVRPASPEMLVKQGASMYRAAGPVQPAGPAAEVKQGYLEASGTNPIEEMVSMISASRAFETNVNMIQHQDNALGRLLQMLPR
jgi:flagellar basal-body rod protein FlgF